MQALNDALKDLKDRLKTQEYTPELLADVCDEWEINPALLLRKFKEQTGKDPSEFKIADNTKLNQKTYEAAKRVAVEWTAKNISGGTSAILGQPFEYDGIPHIAAAWTRDGIHCVDARNLRVMRISFSNLAAASRYIEKHLLKVS